MKTFRHITTTVMCIIMPLATNAQENIAKAFDNFTGDKSYAGFIKTQTFVEQTDEHNLTYCHTYNFKLPANKKKAITNIQEAFGKDACKAYNISKRSSGMSDDILVRISYGINLEKEISFGRKKDYNYDIMLFRDSKDSLKRYVYAMLWTENAKDNNICGSLYKIYGKDPQKTKHDATRSITISKDNGNFIIYDKDENGNLKELYKIKGNSRVIRTTPSGRIITFNAEDTSTDNAGDQQDTSKLTIGFDNDKITNDMDVLLRFGNLRTAYHASMKERGVNNTSLHTVLVNKIVELCKNYGSLLTDSEKDICIDGIKEMQKISVDNYLKNLLNEAIKGLK